MSRAESWSHILALYSFQFTEPAHVWTVGGNGPLQNPSTCGDIQTAFPVLQSLLNCKGGP